MTCMKAILDVIMFTNCNIRFTCLWIYGSITLEYDYVTWFCGRLAWVYRSYVCLVGTSLWLALKYDFVARFYGKLAWDYGFLKLFSWNVAKFV